MTFSVTAICSLPVGKDSVTVSARYGRGIDELFVAVEDIIQRTKKSVEILLPYTEQSLLNGIYKDYKVESAEYQDDGILVKAVIDERGIGLYKKYILN